MDKIFESIRVLLPLSVNDAEFQDPANRDKIRSALRALSDNATALSEHARPRDTARTMLGESIDRDAGDALERYDAGRYESAQFTIQMTTTNCVACHTKLPSPGDAPLSKGFVSAGALAHLPLEERARMEAATRQFDAALGSYEALLSSPGVHPAEMLGPITDYLTISIRVKNDFERPIPVLERFAQRPDLWRHLRLDVEQWIRSLRELRPYQEREPSLEAARELLGKSKQLIEFPADRRAMVHYLVASALLYRFLEDPSRSDLQVAEAYYLLGLTESRIGDGYWISQTELFLETAIRTAPQAPFAERAYALLEEETILGYTGSAGVQLPPSTSKRLEELRALIDTD